MSGSAIPITGKKLAERWEIELIDILFIMMNHDLCVIDQFGDDIFIEDVLENYKRYKDFDIETLIFRLSDVIRLEDDYLSAPLTEKREVVRGKSLMERWEIHEAEVFLIAFQKDWDFVDPFGFPIKYKGALGLWNNQTFSIADALFKTSDVEKFENESGHQIPRTEKAIAERPDISRGELDELDDFPIISFYKNGQIWKIGERGKEKDFKDLKGFEQIRILIANEGRDINIITMHNLGSSPIEHWDRNIGHIPAGVQISDIDRMITTKTDEEDDQRNPGVSSQEPYQELLDRSSVKEIKDTMDLLKGQISQEHDQEKRLEYKEKLGFLERHLLKARKALGKSRAFKSQSRENCRTGVRKSIMRAIQTLHKELPFIKDFINPDTIRTGNTCVYRPDSSKPVNWTLQPPS